MMGREWRLPLLAVMLMGATVGAAGPASSAMSTSPPSTVALPPQLQALEGKMEGLQINSERYSQTIRLTGSTESSEVSSSTEQVRKHERVKPMRHVKLTHEVLTEFGEASLSPNEGELFGSAHSSRPIEITIGSSVYLYERRAARRDGGRPWVRYKAAAGASRGISFPYHGQESEVNLGGNGVYGGLINLLATTTGPVTAIGPVTVDGQQTTEFSAVVEPLTLVRGLPAEQLASLRKELPPETLDVFLAESGLPVRVIRSTGAGADATSLSTDILSINIPVHVKRPSARRTIGQARFNKLSE